jgi:hypothetical protein
MRRSTRRSLLGLDVQDCHGEDIGQVVDTWPDDGGWELQLVVVRLRRFGERRMLAADRLVLLGGVLWTPFSRRQVEDAPVVDGGVHRAEDPWRAMAYWRFEEPGGVGILTPPWPRNCGFSATERLSRTNPSPTPSES